MTHTRTWRVDIHLSEEDPGTHARAVLHSGADTELEGRGSARRNPADAEVPEIGDEIAAARALRELADRLLGAASDDIGAIEQREVHLRG
ncbi:MAG TPA: dsRBD fold-containing protein [Jiangellales bacterium]|nr:dsRBD fold-containing protein [Jiangellales bacterium]